MNNSIRTILGVKNPYLKLDEKNSDNPIELVMKDGPFLTKTGSNHISLFYFKF